MGSAMSIVTRALERSPALFRAARRMHHAWRGPPEPEMRLLPYLVDARRGAIDVGAHRAAYVAQLVRLCPAVTAVEAIPELARFVSRLYPAVRVVTAAAAAEPGEIEFRIPEKAWGLSSAATENSLSGMSYEAIRIPAVTIDSLADAPVGFIKIDVEGYEHAVLQGALTTLQRDRPTLLIEAEERHRPEAVSSLRSFLEPLGYHGLFLDEGRLVSIENFDPARDQRLVEGEAELLNSGRLGRRYINNFIFVS
jgi:FkbM family methyltransferase